MTREAAIGAFLTALHDGLRAVRARGGLVPPSGAEAGRILDACVRLMQPETPLELRLLRRSLYVDGALVPVGLDNFVAYGHLLDTLAGAGVGIVRLVTTPDRGDIEALLSVVVRHSVPEGDPERASKLRRTLSELGVRSIEVEAASAAFGLPDDESRTAARRAYAESVAVSKALFDGARLGRAANVKQVRQAVRGIVDGVLEHEASLGGLSALKDYDDYAFTHAVNVCIFCVAIGRRLGLSKAQLYDLGHAALVHDLGMSRVPREILTKGAALTPDERARMEAHTWLGAMSIFELRDFGEIPFQSMLVAYEHHLKADGSGYPATLRQREPSVFSRIVAVAAAFDAATNERSYQKARPADEVLREFWEDDSFGFDPVIVKALINLLGIYPVGTVVILDTYELAIVHAPNSDASLVHRPVVRLLCDELGVWREPPPLVDLAETDDRGRHLRSIIKVTTADRYGLKVSDYLS